MKKLHLFQWSLCTGFLLASGCAVGQNAPASWIPVGNEKEEVVDAETGKTFVYLTAGESLDTHFHFHGRSWGTLRGTTYLFFSSSRERPVAAGQTVSGERQIMAANVATGDLYYLTTIPNEPSGSSSPWSFRPYFASYNDVAKTIFFWDKQRRKVLGYNGLTGEQKLMLTLPKGATSRELDDFVDDDSIRLIYSYTIREKDGNSGYIAVSDFDRSLNLIETQVVVECPSEEALNHVEINPANQDVFFYKRHHEKRPDGSFGWASLYIKNMADPAAEDFFVNSTNQMIDHMIWGESGKHIYWDDNAGNLWCLDYPSCKAQIVGAGGNIHNQLSPDEKRWVYDTRKGEPYAIHKIDGFTVQCWKGAIGIHDMASNTSEKQANIIWGDPHPRHPHAVFSQDGQWISFVTGTEDGHSRVAIMHVVKQETEK